MLGPQLMIAPVYQPGARRRLVELPPGAWYELYSGRRVDPGPLVAEAPPGRIPVYVRGGSVLTLGNLRQSTAEPLDALTLEVFPDPAGTGVWTLIEDDGESMAYRDGVLAETEYRVATEKVGCILRIDARRGPYRPAARTLVVRLHLPAAPAAVLLDGRETGVWQWQATDRAAVLQWPDDGAAHQLSVRS
jgi:alpha-glucosidase